MRMVDLVAAGEFSRRVPARTVTRSERARVGQMIRDLYPGLNSARATKLRDGLLNLAASSEFPRQKDIPSALNQLADRVVVDLVRAELAESPKERRDMLRRAAARIEWAALLTIGQRAPRGDWSEDLRWYFMVATMCNLFLGSIPVDATPTVYQPVVVAGLFGLLMTTVVGWFLPDRVLDVMATPMRERVRRRGWRVLDETFWFRVEEGLGENAGWRNFVAGRGRGAGTAEIAADVMGWMTKLAGEDLSSICADRLASESVLGTPVVDRR